ncbi:MAG: tRNA uridine-5-carboxymethylaminomethyl(34) synthesis GTPase MnmE [Gemmatimonas sp.]|nr:tRNA uridine-5-carboxymethylaminomethyl(34) synthesis GTPase MnmE [Gemmatimonas sp.]
MGAARASAERRDATIVALATPPGRAALAVVRMSGPAAGVIARRVGIQMPIPPRQVTRVRLHGADSPDAVLDDALATWFAAPHSPTGEDLLELSLHGGAYVSTQVMAALVAAGAVPALAGEFSERAVRHGKMDLLQAEAVADLIDARSHAMHRAALVQLSGALSRRLLALREALVEVEALLAYDIDFPEEDDGPQPRERVTAAAQAVLGALDALGATMPMAELGRDGVPIVLAGAPNAGKSSLFNALLGDARAIVSEIPGTTRDALEAMIDERPYPWRLVDTAGLRDTDDRLERLGVEVSARWLARAAVVVVCAETDDALDTTSTAVASATRARLVLVRTKADAIPSARADAVALSAQQGTGLEALRAAIREAVTATNPAPPEDQPIVTRARHAAALSSARAEVAAFVAAWEADALPAPVAGTHLRAAITALEDLTGAIDVEDVLTRVFRTFCVGK